MTNPDSPRIVFFQVKNAADKVRLLADTAQSHFAKKEKFIIFAEDDRAIEYVDSLLWKYPQVSFLPHAIAENPCPDPIVVTKVKKNLNEARFAFNLCPTPLLIEGFRIIYDLEDATLPNKKLLSQARFDAYKAARYLIESRLESQL